MTISELFKAFRTVRGMTQNQLAELVRKMPNCESFSAQNYASIEAGKTQRTGYILEIARALNIPLELLANPPFKGQAIDFNNPIQSAATAHFIPVLNYKQAISYLDGQTLDIKQWEAVDNNIPANAIGLIVEGQAMSPLLQPEDIAVIVPMKMPEANTQAFLYIKETPVIRSIIKEANSIFFTTVAPGFIPNGIQELSKDDIVYGKVIKIVRYLK